MSEAVRAFQREQDEEGDRVSRVRERVEACPICFSAASLEEQASSVATTLLGCGHFVCNSCLSQHVSRSMHGSAREQRGCAALSSRTSFGFSEFEFDSDGAVVWQVRVRIADEGDLQLLVCPAEHCR